MERLSAANDQENVQVSDNLARTLGPTQSINEGSNEHEVYERSIVSKSKGILIPNILVSNPDYLDASAIIEPISTAQSRELLSVSKNTLTLPRSRSISQESVLSIDIKKSRDAQPQTKLPEPKILQNVLTVPTQSSKIQMNKTRMNKSYDCPRNPSNEEPELQLIPIQKTSTDTKMQKKLKNMTSSSFHATREYSQDRAFPPHRESPLVQPAFLNTAYSSPYRQNAGSKISSTLNNSMANTSFEFSQVFQRKKSIERLQRRIFHRLAPIEQHLSTPNFFRKRPQDTSAHKILESESKPRDVTPLHNQSRFAQYSSPTDTTQKLLSPEYKQAATEMRNMRESNENLNVQSMVTTSFASLEPIFGYSQTKVSQKFESRSNLHRKNSAMDALQALEFVTSQLYCGKNTSNYKKLLRNTFQSATGKFVEEGKYEELHRVMVKKSHDKKIQDKFDKLMQMDITQDSILLEERSIGPHVNHNF